MIILWLKLNHPEHPEVPYQLGKFFKENGTEDLPLTTALRCLTPHATSKLPLQLIAVLGHLQRQKVWS